ELDMSKSSLSRLENGQQRPTIHLLRSMMDLYDFRDDDLLEMAREARKPGWRREHGLSDHHFIAPEAGACEAHAFQLQLRPRLLQTADYARAVFDCRRQPLPEEKIANQLTIRLIRQDRLTDEEDPLELTAIIDENALRRPVGGQSVMRAQLRHLAL